MSELLIQGNALRIPLADESVDLTVTSPPYDDLRSYNGYVFDFEGIASELFRVIKQGSILVWVVGDSIINGSESGSSFRQVLHFKNIGFLLHDTMIYQKAGPAYPSKNKYYQVFEFMFILAKGRPSTFNPIKDRKNRWYGKKFSNVRTRRQKDGSLTRQTWTRDEGEQYGIRFNVWKYTTGHGYQGDEFASLHPASFPEMLASDHIRSWSNPGDVVLDPMYGSGTTLKMAKQLDRNGIGIDISREYIELSRKRILATQPPLFVNI